MPQWKICMKYEFFYCLHILCDGLHSSCLLIKQIDDCTHMFDRFQSSIECFLNQRPSDKGGIHQVPAPQKQ